MVHIMSSEGQMTKQACCKARFTLLYLCYDTAQMCARCRTYITLYDIFCHFDETEDGYNCG